MAGASSFELASLSHRRALRHAAARAVTGTTSSPLVPAKAGTQSYGSRPWIPAFAGMSGVLRRGGILAAHLQRVPQIAHIGHALEREHALDQRGAFCSAQYRRDEVTALGDDLRARYGVVAGAAHGLDVLA